MAKFTVDCEYCAPPNNVLFVAESSPGADEEAFRAAWKAAAPSYESIGCGGCGSQYMLEDDPGGSVQQKNMSRPRIDYMSIVSGSRTGGEAIYIHGSALDIGDIVVKFGGNPALAVTNRTSSQARVVTPRGQYTLDVAETITPGFIVGEEVVGEESGSRAVVRTAVPLVVDSPLRAFSPSELVIGAASGARVRLSTQPYSGVVDVTVENEHGQRLTGGAVLDGFTYL